MVVKGKAKNKNTRTAVNTDIANTAAGDTSRNPSTAAGDSSGNPNIPDHQNRDEGMQAADQQNHQQANDAAVVGGNAPNPPIIEGPDRP